MVRTCDVLVVTSLIIKTLDGFVHLWRYHHAFI